MRFRLCQGVSAPNSEELKSGYKTEGETFSGLASAEHMAALAEGFIDLIDDPVFFLLELPADEEYDVYYLDNCTKEVAHAIMQRYGELLVQDGVSRFGFGSNSSEEELYFMDYQEFMLYTPKTDKAKKLLESLGIKQADKPDSMWEHFTDDEPGTLSVVELEGETVFDIPEALEEAGLYCASRED